MKEGISIVTTCMDREENLRKALGSWLKIEDVKQIVIVDWSSARPLKEAFKDIKSDKILYVTVLGEKFWRSSVPFNLSFDYAKYDKVLKIDSDMIIYEGFLQKHVLEKGMFFRGDCKLARNDNERHINGFIHVFKEDFLNINGYNEYLQSSYGFEDDEFYKRLAKSGLKVRNIDINSVEHIPHDHRSRLKNYMNRDAYPYQISFNDFLRKKINWTKKSKRASFRVIRSSPDEVVVERRGKYFNLKNIVIPLFMFYFKIKRRYIIKK